MMPDLWRDRTGLLRATEDRWELAELTERATESARLVSEDKYDLDYQMDEEEGESFNQRQAELQGVDAPQEGRATGGSAASDRRAAVREQAGTLAGQWGARRA
ncbi:hypothetical protein ABR738_01680 [Streptomyces sp. Edi4]|uniref:hypothetical protein n=1 Tax=Streptomyces sp. Edi4 TaxID=3162527 RepID=UPI003305AD2C